MSGNRGCYEAVRKYSLIRDEMLRMKYEIKIEFREIFHQTKSLRTVMGRGLRFAS